MSILLHEKERCLQAKTPQKMLRPLGPNRNFEAAGQHRAQTTLLELDSRTLAPLAACWGPNRVVPYLMLFPELSRTKHHPSVARLSQQKTIQEPEGSGQDNALQPVDAAISSSPTFSELSGARIFFGIFFGFFLVFFLVLCCFWQFGSTPPTICGDLAASRQRLASRTTTSGF